jgi:TnpA family transposase
MNNNELFKKILKESKENSEEFNEMGKSLIEQNIHDLVMDTASLKCGAGAKKEIMKMLGVAFRNGAQAKALGMDWVYLADQLSR